MRYQPSCQAAERGGEGGRLTLAPPPPRAARESAGPTGGKEGGVGVRMLVPLVDMFNHGGDETAGLLADPHLTTDSVRWDVVAPESDAERGTAGNWEMVVTATQEVPAGCALLLSYGERSGDDFFLHYAGNWEMVVTATQEVPAGFALLLSYGERSGDDVFLHYVIYHPESDAERGTAGNWERVVPAGFALLLSYGERSADDFFLHYEDALGRTGTTRRLTAVLLEDEAKPIHRLAN
eukprot:gene1033-3894_t